MSEYKYQVIALIIVIFLICIFYPPFNIYGCDYNNEIKSMENFAKKDLPLYDNIVGISELCATQLSELTYNLIVRPCTDVSQTEDIISCVSEYDQFYENIIKDPTIGLYNELRNLDGRNHYYDTNIDPHEEYNFMIDISAVYSECLSATMNYVLDNYGFEGFRQDIFIKVMKTFLTDMLAATITKMYTGDTRVVSGNDY
jgi:hypothetical protein